jgi:hypothetical protein
MLNLELPKSKAGISGAYSEVFKASVGLWYQRRKRSRRRRRRRKRRMRKRKRRRSRKTRKFVVQRQMLDFKVLTKGTFSFRPQPSVGSHFLSHAV